MSIKSPMVAEHYVCDICKKRMHMVAETRTAEEDRKECVHTPRFDVHVKCFEKLLTGEQS